MFCDNINMNICSREIIGKVDIGFPTTSLTSILAPQLTPCPHFQNQKHEKITKNWIFHFQIMKFYC